MVSKKEFRVQVAWRTVHVQRAYETVLASSKEEAEEILATRIEDEGYEPDWGKEEMVNGEYIFLVTPVEELK